MQQERQAPFPTPAPRSASHKREVFLFFVAGLVSFGLHTVFAVGVWQWSRANVIAPATPVEIVTLEAPAAVQEKQKTPTPVIQPKKRQAARLKSELRTPSPAVSPTKRRAAGSGLSQAKLSRKAGVQRAQEKSLSAEKRPQLSIAQRELKAIKEATEGGSVLSLQLIYPWESVQRNEQGVVFIRVQWGAEGGILSSQLMKSSGHDRLDTAVLRALRTARANSEYRPAYLKFTFRL